MTDSSAANINNLLNDKLFQVIGSTPRSIAESLSKITLQNRTKEGAQIFAISVFAAAVNKSTLETFLADSRFADIRPLISAALSIQGRSNMTALTLLGHCLLTTDLASSVSFTSEFRKKMGQRHLWDGDLDKGSLSDKQKEILKEKKRVTDQAEATALGNGFLKITGLLAGSFTATEADMFKQASSDTFSTLISSARSKRAETSSPPVRPVTSIGEALGVAEITSVDELPTDVLNYRRNVMNRTDEEILNSIRRDGLTTFLERTRTAISRDPTGRIGSAGSTVGR